MEPVIYRITLKMNGGSAPSLGMRQGDTRRRIYFSLAQDGKPYEISPGCYAVLAGVKPDGTTLLNDCVVDGNTIIYDVTEQTTAVKGRVKCELKLYDVQEQLVTSPGFEIVVHGAVLPGGDVASSDEANALRKMVSDGLEAIADCDNAAQRAMDATQDAEDAANNANRKAEAATAAADAANAAANDADAASASAIAVTQDVQGKLDSGAFVGPQGEKGEKGDKGDPGWDTVEITVDESQDAMDIASSMDYAQIHSVFSETGYLRAVLHLTDKFGTEHTYRATAVKFDNYGYGFTFDSYGTVTVNSADEWSVEGCPVEMIGGVTYATMLGVGDLNAERSELGDPPGAFFVYAGTREDGVTDQVELNSTHNFGSPVGLRGIAPGVDDTDAVNVKQLKDAELGMVDKLCPAFTESGAVVTCEPVEGYPLQVVSGIVPNQSGSGDPSPENVRPIEGHTALTLTQCGKNLVDTDVLLNSYLTKDENGIYHFDGNVPGGSGAIIFNPPIPANTPIHYKFYDFGGYNANSDALLTTSVSFADGTMEGGNWFGVSQSFTNELTLKKQKAITAFQFYKYQPSEDFRCQFSALQVEIGETATDYEPYQEGDTFTMDLGQTVCGGTLDWQTGVLTVEYGIQDLSALTWSYTTNSYGFGLFYSTNAFSAAADNVPGGHKGWCSVFNCVNGHSLNAIPNNCLMYSILDFSAAKRIYIRADSIGSADALLEALKGQTLVYQLAEPITVQLTPQQIVALSGVNTIYSDTGDTTVTGKADPVAINENLLARIAALEAAAVNNT